MANDKLYFFKCPVCGEYQTTAETFRKFCPDKAWQRIQNSKDAIGGLVDFKTECPKCAPSGQGLNKIILLRPKRQKLN